MRRRQECVKDLRRLLVEYNFLNREDEKLDINNQYELRVKGLNGQLSDDELAAALLQIVKHRGISYDLGDLDDEDTAAGTAFKESINRNRRELNANLPVI